MSEFVEQLVRDGWRSTSNKYCLIARWAVPEPRIEDLITPEAKLNPHFDRIVRVWERHKAFNTDLRSNHPCVESKQLTPEQFAAFRAAGGESA